MLLFMPHMAEALQVREATIELKPREEILTLKLDEAVTPKSFVLTKPDRLVIDLPPFIWKVDSEKVVKSGSKLVKRIRYARFDVGVSRIVVDLHQPISYQKPSSGKSRSLKFVLRALKAGAQASSQVSNKAASNVSSGTASASQEEVPSFWSRRSKRKRLPPVIVQDAQSEVTTQKIIQKRSAKVTKAAKITQKQKQPKALMGIKPKTKPSVRPKVSRKKVASAAQVKQVDRATSVRKERPSLPTSKARSRKDSDRPLIVIDAGHGGRDSGAIGKNKT